MVSSWFIEGAGCRGNKSGGETLYRTYSVRTKGGEEGEKKQREKKT